MDGHGNAVAGLRVRSSCTRSRACAWVRMDVSVGVVRVIWKGVCLTVSPPTTVQPPDRIGWATVSGMGATRPDCHIVGGGWRVITTLCRGFTVISHGALSALPFRIGSGFDLLTVGQCAQFVVH